ncbi:hypothetical protein REPUB_Repub05bG0068600 [Reevesia pubescens]
MAIWIQLSELSIENYGRDTLHKIAKLLGCPIKIDVHTRNVNKAKYARICVEVSIDKVFASGNYS